MPEVLTKGFSVPLYGTFSRGTLGNPLAKRILQCRVCAPSTRWGLRRLGGLWHGRGRAHCIHVTRAHTRPALSIYYWHLANALSAYFMNTALRVCDGSLEVEKCYLGFVKRAHSLSSGLLALWTSPEARVDFSFTKPTWHFLTLLIAPARLHSDTICGGALTWRQTPHSIKLS